MGFFYFKKFRIRQTLSSMKVSTDSVLLPAWTNMPGTWQRGVRVLDAGCGTGVISLIMAQRMEAADVGSYKISAIDIDEHSCEECSYNFSLSPWSACLETANISMQDFAGTKSNQHTFDIILSNPPFFTDSLKAPSLQRSNARHNDLLPLEDIARCAIELLKDGGVLSLILPEKEAVRFLEIAGSLSLLSVIRVCKVKTLAYKRAKRWMLEVKKEKTPADESIAGGYISEELTMQRQGGDRYTREYINLVKEYYIKEFKVD